MDVKEKLKKAKALILIENENAFLATILLSLKHEIDKETPTAKTNGTKIVYGEDFIENLSVPEVAFVMAHEVWHIALLHTTPSRLNNRDPMIWNMAGDFVINLLLDRNPFKFVEGGLLDYGYRNYTTEEVYEDLIKNAQKVPENFEMDIEEGTSEDEQDIKEILIKAATVAKQSNNWGDTPGELIRSIEQLVNPKIPWNSLLMDYLTAMNKEDYSWRRPNKRYSDYLPSLYSEGLGDIVIAIDTSGSVGDEDMKFMLSEIQYIADTFNISSLTILDCDHTIHNIHKVEKGENVTKLQFGGYGGTSCFPILEYCDEHNPDVLIYFTDGYMQLPEDVPEYSMLWLIYNNPSFKEPFGRVIYYE